MPVNIGGFAHNYLLYPPVVHSQDGKLKLSNSLIEETVSDKGLDRQFGSYEFKLPEAGDDKSVELLDSKSHVILELTPHTENEIVGALKGVWADDLTSDDTVYFALRRPLPSTVTLIRSSNSSEQLIESRNYLLAALSSLSADLIDKSNQSDLSEAIKTPDHKIIITDFKQIVDPQSHQLLLDFVKAGGRLFLIPPDQADADFINGKLNLSNELYPITSIQSDNTSVGFSPG